MVDVFKEQQRDQCVWSHRVRVFRMCHIEQGYHSHCRPVLTYISFWTFWPISHTAGEGSLLHKLHQLAQHRHAWHSTCQHIHMPTSILLCCDQSLRLVFHWPAAPIGLVPNFWPHWSHQHLTWLPFLGMQSGLLVWAQGFSAYGS